MTDEEIEQAAEEIAISCRASMPYEEWKLYKLRVKGILSHYATNKAERS